jgi:hypothetical protein
MDRFTYTLRILGEVDMHVVATRKHEVLPCVLAFAAQLSFSRSSVVRVYENGKLFREVVVRTTL